ncbi:hypothetical protein PINS_up000480 [Pythium insidiosum]|nr:hypothetical protein PINS_up000480 [Pythium insidiosum]
MVLDLVEERYRDVVHRFAKSWLFCSTAEEATLLGLLASTDNEIQLLHTQQQKYGGEIRLFGTSELEDASDETEQHLKLRQLRDVLSTLEARSSVRFKRALDLHLELKKLRKGLEADKKRHATLKIQVDDYEDQLDIARRRKSAYSSELDELCRKLAIAEEELQVLRSRTQEEETTSKWLDDRITGARCRHS